MATKVLGIDTRVAGAQLPVVLPMPSLPLVDSPQAQTWPALSSASECAMPVATARIPPGRPLTCTGVWRCTASLAGGVPYWPRELWPQIQTVPSLRTANEKLLPAAIAV